MPAMVFRGSRGSMLNNGAASTSEETSVVRADHDHHRSADQWSPCPSPRDRTSTAGHAVVEVVKAEQTMAEFPGPLCSGEIHAGITRRQAACRARGLREDGSIAPTMHSCGCPPTVRPPSSRPDDGPQHPSARRHARVPLPASNGSVGQLPGYDEQTTDIANPQRGIH